MLLLLLISFAFYIYILQILFPLFFSDVICVQIKCALFAYGVSWMATLLLFQCIVRHDHCQ